jgi:Holliday junction resolvase
MMRENRVERELVKRVKDLGGMCEKFTSPGRRSVPDRLVTLPGGRIIFVECKAPGKEPTITQRRDHERRRLLGCDVRVIDNIEDARSFK